MKTASLCFASLLTFALAGCDAPTDQDDEKEAPAPDAEASMQESPDAMPVDVDTDASVASPQTTDSRIGKETGESEEQDEEADPSEEKGPPPR